MRRLAPLALILLLFSAQYAASSVPPPSIVIVTEPANGWWLIQDPKLFTLDFEVEVTPPGDVEYKVTPKLADSGDELLVSASKTKISDSKHKITAKLNHNSAKWDTWAEHRWVTVKVFVAGNEAVNVTRDVKLVKFQRGGVARPGDAAIKLDFVNTATEETGKFGYTLDNPDPMKASPWDAERKLSITRTKELKHVKGGPIGDEGSNAGQFTIYYSYQSPDDGEKKDFGQGRAELNHNLPFTGEGWNWAQHDGDGIDNEDLAMAAAFSDSINHDAISFPYTNSRGVKRRIHDPLKEVKFSMGIDGKGGVTTDLATMITVICSAVTATNYTIDDRFGGTPAFKVLAEMKDPHEPAAFFKIPKTIQIAASARVMQEYDYDYWVYAEGKIWTQAPTAFVFYFYPKFTGG